MQLDLNHFKKKLFAEKIRLEEEMATVGRRNPTNPADWQEAERDMDILAADKNEIADKFEEVVDNRAVLNELEAEHSEVVAALERIESGEYGKCENGGEDIPTERLEVYPAARTCITHANISP